tara:strand:- start:8487 stop:9401 length:915 start_codon:yes stop_codon:yes gene_type:complete
MRYLILAPLISFIIAQDMQVKYVVAYTIDVDWGGEIETVSEITAAPGYGKFNGQLNPKRWIFRIFGGQRGFIKVPGTENFLGYNVKRKRYWVTPPGEDPLFADMNWGDESGKEVEEKKDNEDVSVTIKTEEEDSNTQKGGKEYWFIKIANDIFKDDDAPPRIERTLNESIEEINGFRTKKWTTTISTKNNKMIIEEWVVDELPLRDSLYAYISSISEENNELINFIDSVKFSSQDFILGVDSSYTIKKSDEIIVMAKMGIDSNNGWVQSALFEIRELYALSFDPLTFTIPEDFERIEIESDEKD